MQGILDRLGWSQKYFATRVNVSVNTVNNWVKKSKGQGYTVAMKYLEDECRRQGV